MSIYSEKLPMLWRSAQDAFRFAGLDVLSAFDFPTGEAAATLVLEELCRATIAELKAYPGPYCIESFDPRVVGIVRRQAPGLLRGQLADSYRSYRKTGAHPVPAFVFSHCLSNFLGRPDFIAWCPEKRNWAVRLCARLGAMMVMWTALPEHDTRKLEAENDAVIFQWYAPKQQYK